MYERTSDRDWLSVIWPEITRCLDYMLDERDLFGDGLVSIVHPWESGTDLSPQFFPAMGIDPARRSHVLRATSYSPLLYHFCNRMSWDLKRLRDANKFIFEDLTVNCITIRALRSASYLASVMGDELAAKRYQSRAALMAEALDDICFDERSGLYYSRWDVERPKLARVETASSLMPLFAGLCRAERCERLVKEHALNPSEFWVDYLFPFNPADELAGSRPWVEGKLWAGHCIWINFNWMIAVGLGEHGFFEQAREITRRTVEMVLKEGFCEFYDSRTGEGQRIRDFCWPGLALDMMARFWPEAVMQNGVRH